MTNTRVLKRRIGVDIFYKAAIWCLLIVIAYAMPRAMGAGLFLGNHIALVTSGIVGVLMIAGGMYLFKTTLLARQINSLYNVAHMPFDSDSFTKLGKGFYGGEEWLIYEENNQFQFFNRYMLSDIREWCTHKENVKGLIEITPRQSSDMIRIVFDRVNDAELPSALKHWLYPTIDRSQYICPNCQSIQLSENTYCENCGKRIHMAALRNIVDRTMPKVENVNLEAASNNSSFNMFFIGLAILIIIGIFWLLLSGTGGLPL